MSKPRVYSRPCPNCAQPVGAESAGCVLHSLIAALRDRESLPALRLLALHAAVDADILWAHVGPILDALEAGEMGAP